MKEKLSLDSNTHRRRFDTINQRKSFLRSEQLTLWDKSLKILHSHHTHVGFQRKYSLACARQFTDRCLICVYNCSPRIHVCLFVCLLYSQKCCCDYVWIFSISAISANRRLQTIKQVCKCAPTQATALNLIAVSCTLFKKAQNRVGRDFLLCVSQG